MSVFETIVEAGDRLGDLASELSKWSQATFGSDAERGPVGPLRHLQMEAQEAINDPTNLDEYADCFILVLDAARRAGHKPLELIKAAQRKLEICKTREYPRPITDEPSEHVRSDGP